jgi:hypothetical protein
MRSGRPLGSGSRRARRSIDCFGRCCGLELFARSYFLSPPSSRRTHLRSCPPPALPAPPLPHCGGYTTPRTTKKTEVHAALARRTPTRPQDRATCAFCAGKGGGGVPPCRKQAKPNAAGGHGAKRTGRAIRASHGAKCTGRAIPQAANAQTAQTVRSDQTAAGKRLKSHAPD